MHALFNFVACPCEARTHSMTDQNPLKRSDLDDSLIVILVGRDRRARRRRRTAQQSVPTNCRDTKRKEGDRFKSFILRRANQTRPAKFANTRTLSPARESRALPAPKIWKPPSSLRQKSQFSGERHAADKFCRHRCCVLLVLVSPVTVALPVIPNTCPRAHKAARSNRESVAGL